MGGSKFCDLRIGKLVSAHQSPRATQLEPNTYRAGGVNAHEFHLGVFTRLCELEANSPRFKIMLFE